MKKLFTVAVTVLVIFISSYASAQKTSVAEYEKIDVQVELLLDTAAKHMLYFILTKSESEYNTALVQIEEAEKLNKILEKKVDGLTGTTLKLEKQELEDRKEEFVNYHDPKLKSDIMDEADKDRTTVAKFRGKAYKVGKASQAKYDIFITYLPRN
jgi:DNA topoisomerase VI subunit B